jgi:hypothetical protein
MSFSSSADRNFVSGQRGGSRVDSDEAHALRLCRQYDAQMIETLFNSVLVFSPGERRDEEIRLVSSKVARTLRAMREALDSMDDQAPVPSEIVKAVHRLEGLVMRLDQARKLDLQ